MMNRTCNVIPAQAGIQWLSNTGLDPRLRGDDA